jgi:sigma-B regulation protein RsbU (phosphoserine phosphatase)
MTAFLGILDPGDGNFEYASAGHPLPRWWQASTQSMESMQDVGGLPLGLVPDVRYGDGTMTVSPGDLFVSYSDGLTDAQDSTGHLFGRDRLDLAIQQAALQGADVVLGTLLANLAAFVGGNQPHDDITVLIIEREGDKGLRPGSG